LLIQGLASLTKVRDLAAQDARVLLLIVRPLQSEGAGNAGCPMHPQPGVRILIVSMHTSIHSGSTGNIRHPPRNGFTAYSALFPGTNCFVDPVIRATRWRLANLTPASGRQNHTASPSATASARLTLRRVHRIPPRERGDRVSPLWWDGTGESIALILPSRQAKYSEKQKNIRGAADDRKTPAVARHNSTLGRLNSSPIGRASTQYRAC